MGSENTGDPLLQPLGEYGVDPRIPDGGDGLGRAQEGRKGVKGAGVAREGEKRSVEREMGDIILGC